MASPSPTAACKETRSSTTSPLHFRALALLREAVSGNEHDYTRGSVSQALLLLAIPMVLEMFMESLFAVADAFFLARLGSVPLAAAGLTESLLTVIYAVAEGLAVSTTAMIARRIGEQDLAGARRALVQSVLAAALVGATLGIFGGLFAKRVLMLMGASPDVTQHGASYATIQLASAPVIVLLFVLNAAFRGAGDAALAMRALWIANGMNLWLDPCLIFGLGPFPELGLTGAAVATVTGRSLGVLYQLRVLFRGSSRIGLRGARWRLDPKTFARLLRLAGQATLQFLLATTSWVALVRVVAVFGSVAVAGYTIGVRILVFVLLPAWGLANATATLVGQALGAGDPVRAGRAVHLAGLYNMAFLALVELLCVLWDTRILAWFTTEPAVVVEGARCLRYFAYGCVVYAWGMVLVQAFNGAGDTRTPMWINFCCYWVVQIPLAYLLALPAQLGPVGVYLAVLVAETSVAAVGWWLFRRGSWRDVRL